MNFDTWVQLSVCSITAWLRGFETSGVTKAFPAWGMASYTKQSLLVLERFVTNPQTVLQLTEVCWVSKFWMKKQQLDHLSHSETCWLLKQLTACGHQRAQQPVRNWLQIFPVPFCFTRSVAIKVFAILVPRVFLWNTTALSLEADIFCKCQGLMLFQRPSAELLW